MAFNKNKNLIRFSSPSKWWGSAWREALLSGNGRIGCSVLGGAGEDSIMLTHADLWWQGKVGVLPEVCENLPKVRKAVDEGKFEEASAIIPDALILKGYRPQMSYPLPLCDFKINQKCDKPPKDYCRSLNLESGEISVSFKDGTTKYQRSVFVLRKEDLVVFEITKSGNKAIDAEFTLCLHEKFNNRTVSSFTALPASADTKSEGKFISFSARADNGLDFGAVAYVNFFGGSLVNNGEYCEVKDAEKIFIVIKPFINVKNREIKFKEIREELKGFKSTYEKLLKEQTAEMGKILNRAYISLNDDDSFMDKTLDSQDLELTPAIIEKFWTFGRYLFISSTSPQSLPIAPYGLWCGDYKGLNSHINADSSMQLMYEHALSGNLTDYFEALLNFYENCLDDLKKNAIRLFDVRGIMIPSVVAKGTGLIGLTEPKVVNFTGAAAYLCRMFYDYYLCTRDNKLLKTRIMPFLKETAQFYMEFFKLKEDSYYESNPSYSPDSLDEKVAIGKNALIDFALSRQVFKSLIEVSEELGINKAEIQGWSDFLNHIPDYKVNSDGTIKEYFDLRISDNIKSPSTALFYPVFPSSEVNESSGEIFKQFEKTALKRFSFGSHHTSMSLMRFANVFVRLNETQITEDIITALMKHTCMSNMVFSSSDWTGMGVASNDIWASFNIETNLLLTNAIQEMLLRSDKNTIYLLPATNIQKGELGGFLTRTGVEVLEMVWNKGQINLKLKAKKQTSISLKIKGQIKKYKGIGAVEADQCTITNIELPASKIISLEIRM